MPTTPLPAAAAKANAALDGALKAKLVAWRKEGQSWQDIADLLHGMTRGRVDVTDEAVRKWAKRLGLSTARMTAKP